MYVDGFVLPVPKKNLDKYIAMAKTAGKVWMEHGAIAYHECVEDDVQKGKVTSFPQSVQLKKGEVVVFSWAVYKSRKERDAIMKKVMNDPRLAGYNPQNMPFDGMRMFWGGFSPIVSMEKSDKTTKAKPAKAAAASKKTKSVKPAKTAKKAKKAKK